MRANSMILAVAMVLSAGPALAQDATAGAQLYADFCGVCHGEDGRGNGVMAEVLTIQPSNLATLSVDGEFPILQVVRQIDGRDPMLAHGGEMPLFGQWFEGEGADVAMPGPGGQPILMSRPIADLVAYLIEIQS